MKTSVFLKYFVHACRNILSAVLILIWKSIVQPFFEARRLLAETQYPSFLQ